MTIEKSGGSPRVVSLLTGPVAGLLLAATVLTLSFLVGRLEPEALLNALLVVAVSSFTALAFLVVATATPVVRWIRAGVADAVSDERSELDDIASSARTILETVTEEIEAQRASLLELEFADDVTLARMQSGKDIVEVFSYRRAGFIHSSAVETIPGECRRGLSRGVKYIWIGLSTAESINWRAQAQADFAGYPRHVSIQLLREDQVQALDVPGEIVILTERSPSNTLKRSAFAEVSFGLGPRAWRQAGPEICTRWWQSLESMMD